VGLFDWTGEHAFGFDCPNAEIASLPDNTLVVIGCDDLDHSSATTLVHLNQDKDGLEWNRMINTMSAPHRSFWPPRKGAKVIALADNSVMVCGGMDTSTGGLVDAGQGI